jgi:hypothetical protein
MAVIYYSGHGMEIAGENWLIPVDAELLSDRDAENEAIPLKSAIYQVANGSSLGLVILDACRNNPFAAKCSGVHAIAQLIAVSSALSHLTTCWLHTPRERGQSPVMAMAELEYVSRAGTTTPFWSGNSITPKQANYDGTSAYDGGSKGENRKQTVPVGSFAPNPWRLYDVHGNVWEWTQDCWNDNTTGNQGDGAARTRGNCSRRVLRGGSWSYRPGDLRAASRIKFSTVSRFDIVGFRVARTLSQ